MGTSYRYYTLFPLRSTPIKHYYFTCIRNKSYMIPQIISPHDTRPVYEFFTVNYPFRNLFYILQGMEYSEASFSISDCVYGSTFFIATGFHGIHVLVGTLFLIFSLIRIKHGLLNHNHYVGFLSAIWYWHFVDIV